MQFKWLDVLVFSDKDDKPQAPSPASALYWLAGDVKEPTHSLAKSRARSSRCCGLALFHGLVLQIGITSLGLSPLGWTCPRKLIMSSFTKSQRVMHLTINSIFRIRFRLIIPQNVWRECRLKLSDSLRTAKSMNCFVIQKNRGKPIVLSLDCFGRTIIVLMSLVAT